MTIKKSLSDRFTEEAFRRGYYADKDGSVFKPNGKPVSTSYCAGGHLKTTLYFPEVGGSRGCCPVLVHRMVVYQFYGDELFEHRLVRHLNSVPDDNRVENLALGNHRENRADVDPSLISKHAKKHAHLLVGRNRKLSDDDIIKMRKVREEEGIPYKELGQMFGVTTMTAHRACNGKAWNNIKEED